MLKYDQKLVINTILDLISINKELKDDKKDLLKKLIITLLAFDIIGKQFLDKKEEWRMIGKKVTKWVKETKETIMNMKDIKEI